MTDSKPEELEQSNDLRRAFFAIRELRSLDSNSSEYCQKENEISGYLLPYCIRRVRGALIQHRSPLKDHDTAATISHEVIARILGKIDTNRDGSNFTAYLNRSIDNRVKSFISYCNRSNRKLPRGVKIGSFGINEIPDPTGAQGFEDIETGDTLEAAKKILNPSEHAAFSALCKNPHRDSQELAALTDSPNAKAFMERVRRARTKLADHPEVLGYDFLSRS